MGIFTDAQFDMVMVMLFFMFFLGLGYIARKRSGGAFMLIAGFMLFDLSVLLSVSYSWLFLAYLVPAGIFIILLGIQKWLYAPETEEGAGRAKGG